MMGKTGTRKWPKKSIDDAVVGLSNARAVLDGIRDAGPSPWAEFEGMTHLREEHIVEDAPLVEPPPENPDDWSATRRDLQ